MIKFDDTVEEYKINLNNLDHLIVDLQSSEIQFLNGSKNSLSFCKSIVIEVSQKNFYEKCSTSMDELKLFLNKRDFINFSEPKSDHCDTLFKRVENEK